MNSEITMTKNDSASPRRMPVRISGSAAGSRTRKKSWRGRAPRLWAARTRSGSIRRTAWTVVRNIGKNVAYVMKPTLDSSPMPIHTMKSGSIASGGSRGPGGQADGEREDGAGAEAQGDALERGAHVSPELAVQRELHGLADDEPRPGQEDRIDEPEGLHDSRNERPRREEERDRADAHPERAPPRQRGAPQAPLHHLGDGRQQGRLDRASLLLPRIVGGIDVRDSGRAEAVDLDDRLFFRPGEVRGLGARDEEAAWRKRLALRLAQLRTVAGVERSGDDGHVLVRGMRVSRGFVVRGVLVPEGERSRLSGVALQQHHLQPGRQRCRAIAPLHLIGREHDHAARHRWNPWHP